MHRTTMLDAKGQVAQSCKSLHRLNGTTISPSRPRRRIKLLPSGYEPSYPYPLLLWLHGGGDDERQLLTVMRHISLQNYLSAAPRGLPSASPEGSRRHFWTQSLDGVDHALACVHDCVDELTAEYSIHPRRVFLAGYADGGTMALRLAFSEPQRYAGVVALNAAFPVGNHPVRSLDGLRRLPFFVGYGEASQLYPQSKVDDDLRLLHAIGATAMVRQYPCDDCPTTIMFADVNRWLMERITGTRLFDCKEAAEASCLN